MIEFDNRTEVDLPIDLLERIAIHLSNQEIELILTDNHEITKINHEFRQKNMPTDVLSFPYEAMPMSPLGSIVISIDFIKEGALKYAHHETDEFALLFLHGLLHLLGYDHENDQGEMRAKEAELINAFALPKSLIVRTED